MDTLDLSLYLPDVQRFKIRGAGYLIPMNILAVGTLCAMFSWAAWKTYMGSPSRPLSFEVTMAIVALILVMVKALQAKIWTRYADLIINHDGMCRQVYGIHGKRLAWCDIKSINVKRLSPLDNDLQPYWYIGFHRYDPAVKGAFGRRLKPEIVFMDNTGYTDNLISLLNDYAKKHNIKLYQLSGREYQPLERLQLMKDEALARMRYRLGS